MLLNTGRLWLVRIGLLPKTPHLNKTLCWPYQTGSRLLRHKNIHDLLKTVTIFTEEMSHRSDITLLRVYKTANLIPSKIFFWDNWGRDIKTENEVNPLCHAYVYHTLSCTTPNAICFLLCLDNLFLLLILILMHKNILYWIDTFLEMLIFL